MRKMNRIAARWSRTLACSTILLSIPWGVEPGHAGPWCDRTNPNLPPAPANPQNIIVFVLDDTTISALPTFSNAVGWPSVDDPPSTTGGSTAREKHLARLRRSAQRQRPDLNLFAARSNAVPRLADRSKGDLGRVVASDSAAALAAPLDLDLDSVATGGAAIDGTASTFAYEVDGTEPRVRVVQGFGGLGRLAREGVSFTRFYATAGLCSPTRASIMTGRYPTQVGVPANKTKLDEDEFTFSQFLQQQNGDQGGTHYRIGHFGKWHLGDDTSSAISPWSRGVDVALYDTANARPHWSLSRIGCGPLEVEHPNTVTSIPPSGPVPHAPGFYCDDPATWAVTCETQVQCQTAVAVCGAAGEQCVCSIPARGEATGHCYPEAPQECNPADLGACSSNPKRCKRWETYFGPDPGPVGCHPDDGANPFCCSESGPFREGSARTGVYRPSRKKTPAGEDLFLRDRGASCAASDEGFDLTGCAYDTRFYRDMMKNFIVRSAHGQAPGSASTERFLAYYAPHATHTKSSAPDDTLEKYQTVKKAANGEPIFPTGADGFWPAMEEVDAAVGDILSIVDGFCDTGTAPGNDDPSEVNYGVACNEGDSSPCGGGVCNSALRDQTLVLFTADQGTPDSSYGEPWLAGGKNSTFEGGLRVGISAWGPGLQIGEGATGRIDETNIGSEVDIFATIAHAAGCKPTYGATGYQIGFCSDSGFQKACGSNADCDSPATCWVRPLEGKSLLPTISGTVRALYQTASTTNADLGITGRRRNLAFAHWDSGTTPSDVVIARSGYFLPPAAEGNCASPGCPAAAERAAKICSFRIDAAPVLGGTTLPGGTTNADNKGDRLGVVRRGGSCQPCNDSALATDFCTGVLCRVNGKFCVSNSALIADPCTDTDPDSECEVESYLRCESDSDCDKDGTTEAEKESCIEVFVGCNSCTEANWKYSFEGSSVHPFALFDLNSNPEESGTKKPNGDALNCRDPASRVGLKYPSDDNSALDAVESYLDDKLTTWKATALLPKDDHSADAAAGN